ncbi:MAG: methyltransferase family protein [Candidatus Sulfotelmatobacter sp.]
MKQVLWKSLSASLGYLAVAVLSLVQWNGPSYWLRLDWFAGGYFILRFAGSLHSIISSLGAFRSHSVREAWWALDSYPEGPKWVMLLMAFDLVVFLDYGHCRLTPGLLKPALQTVGVALYLAVTIWQTWTDAYLARYFNNTQTPLIPMEQGPYRYVRHPRYGGAIVGKVAMALIFGSLFGWALAFAWGLLLLKKINIEEKHLRKIFGTPYESYSQSTAKIIPGIY